VSTDARAQPDVLAASVAWALVGLFALIAAVLLWFSLPWPLIHDAPTLHYIATRIAAGAVPYRDVFDMNQPGAYLVHRAVVAWLGAGDVAWRGFDVAWLVLTCVAAAIYARPWGTAAAGGAAALFAVYHVTGGAWQAGQRDFLLCVWLLGAAAAAVAWLEDATAGAWRLAAAGFVLGAGIALKPHAVIFAVALGVVIARAARRRSVGVAALALYTGGLAVVPLAVAAWLVARGAFDAWREILFGYLLPLYARLTRPEDWNFWRVEVWYAIGAAVVLSLAATVWERRFGWRHGIAVLGLAYGVLHYVGQGKGWEYHLYPLAAFAAVLAFSTVEGLLARRRRAAGGLVALILVAGAAVLARRGWDATNARWVWDKEYVVRLLAADLGLNMRPMDRVQMLDTTEGGTHALLRLGVPSATRFIYDFHFFHDVDHPTIQRLRAEFVRDLAARPPRFVVVFTRGWPSGKLERITRFPALNDFLEANYRAVQRRNPYLILEARPRP
jgi:hypothetical protein